MSIMDLGLSTKTLVFYFLLLFCPLPSCRASLCYLIDTVSRETCLCSRLSIQKVSYQQKSWTVMVRFLICTCSWRDIEARELEGNSTGWREILRNGSSQKKDKVTETSSHQYARIGGLWLQSFHHRQSKMKPWSPWPKHGSINSLCC